MKHEDINDYGEDVYKIDVPASCNMIIFNDGSNQTGNINAGSDANYWYDGTVHTW